MALAPLPQFPNAMRPRLPCPGARATVVSSYALPAGPVSGRSARSPQRSEAHIVRKQPGAFSAFGAPVGGSRCPVIVAVPVRMCVGMSLRAPSMRQSADHGVVGLIDKVVPLRAVEHYKRQDAYFWIKEEPRYCAGTMGWLAWMRSYGS